MAKSLESYVKSAASHTLQDWQSAVDRLFGRDCEGGIAMVWQLRVRYANGTEKILKSFKSKELAIRWVDWIYTHGYPLHFAYIVRQSGVRQSGA